MRKYAFLLAVFTVLMWSCDTSTTPEDVIPGQDETPESTPDNTSDPENPVVEWPIVPQKPDPIKYANDSRLTAFGDAESAKWIRYPNRVLAFRFNIAENDPAAALCTEPGWAYLFYNDGAVIGYAPFPDRVDIMHTAVAITVESHNLEKPSEKWGFINVPMPSPPPPVTSNDPVLGKWQFALCLDDGSIVDGPYTAEFEFNWRLFKDVIARQMWEVYNIEHDPDAHIVWGTE